MAPEAVAVQAAAEEVAASPVVCAGGLLGGGGNNRPTPTAAAVPTVAPPSDKKTALFPLASPAGPDSGQAAPKTGASGSDIIEDDDTSMDTADPDFSQDFELDDAQEVTKSAPVISNEGIKSF